MKEKYKPIKVKHLVPYISFLYDIELIRLTKQYCRGGVNKFSKIEEIEETLWKGGGWDIPEKYFDWYIAKPDEEENSIFIVDRINEYDVKIITIQIYISKEKGGMR